MHTPLDSAEAVDTASSQKGYISKTKAFKGGNPAKAAKGALK